MQKFAYKIVKKGRKWFEGINGKGYKAQILINEISSKWQEGQTVEFFGKEEVERSKFGTSIKIYPVPSEDGIKEEYEKWKGYIENAKKDGYLYEKGIVRLKELAKVLGNTEETEKYIQEVKQHLEERNIQKRYDTLLSYLMNPLSLSNFYKNYEELQKLVEKYTSLQERFEQDKDKIKQYEIKTKEKEALKKIEIYKEEFKRRNDKIENEIRTLAMENQEILQLLEKEIEVKKNLLLKYLANIARL